jgi:hypothetical protein
MLENTRLYAEYLSYLGQDSQGKKGEEQRQPRVHGGGRQER